MPSLIDIAVAVWNHPQGRAALISACAAAPIYINTPATRDLFWRFGPTLFVVLAIGLAALPSGIVKDLQREVLALKAEVKRLKGRRR